MPALVGWPRAHATRAVRARRPTTTTTPHARRAGPDALSRERVTYAGAHDSAHPPRRLSCSLKGAAGPSKRCQRKAFNASCRFRLAVCAAPAAWLAARTRQQRWRPRQRSQGTSVLGAFEARERERYFRISDHMLFLCSCLSSSRAAHLPTGRSTGNKIGEAVKLNAATSAVLRATTTS